MPQPLMHEIQGNAGGHRSHPEPVPQPLGRGVRAVEPGILHDGMHRPPAGHAALGPERPRASMKASDRKGRKMRDGLEKPSSTSTQSEALCEPWRRSDGAKSSVLRLEAA